MVLVQYDNIPYWDASRDVANWKPSNFIRRSWILGIGYSLRLIILFISQKSDIKWVLPSFLGIMNVGTAHSLRLMHFSMPSLIKHSSSTLSIA